MAIGVQFLARFAVPAIVAAIFLQGNVHEQRKMYETILVESDKVVSVVNGEGDGPVPELYDYVIIGAGASGSVLAKRLVEVDGGSNSVLVLEAGGDPNPISEVPWVVMSLMASDSDMMYHYESVPQTRACGYGRCQFWRGRAVGGSSSINGLVYNRCSAKDYDSWANFSGDSTWAFDNLVDAFKAIESYHGFYEDNPGPTHGTDGELYIGKIDYLPGVDVLIDALREGGYSVGDLNSGFLPSGFSKIDFNIKNGLRWSAYHAFLEPILDKVNFKLYRYAQATKIHLDESRRAYGVTYKRHGQERFVRALKEVIVAGGVIDTPKLLMLSGIGPREHLTQLGIETLVDLPAVGDHLQEHVGTSAPHFTINRTFGVVNPETPENLKEYLENGTGPLLGVPWGTFSIHLVHGYITSKIRNDPTWPDIHMYINQHLREHEGVDEPEETIKVEMELVLSEQTGTIRLASTDPNDPPLIDPRFFHDPMDLERFIEGFQEMINFFLNSPTFRALGLRWSEHRQILPECEPFIFPTTAYWRCYIPLTSGAAFHPTSSCRMGPNNQTAAVDSRLRVFGTTGLRVIDSSIMPFAPNGNTNLPSMMIGEMGARFILGQIP